VLDLLNIRPTITYLREIFDAFVKSSEIVRKSRCGQLVYFWDYICWLFYSIDPTKGNTLWRPTQQYIFPQSMLLVSESSHFKLLQRCLHMYLVYCWLQISEGSPHSRLRGNGIPGFMTRCQSIVELVVALDVPASNMVSSGAATDSTSWCSCPTKSVVFTCWLVQGWSHGMCSLMTGHNKGQQPDEEGFFFLLEWVQKYGRKVSYYQLVGVADPSQAATPQEMGFR